MRGGFIKTRQPSISNIGGEGKVYPLNGKSKLQVATSALQYVLDKHAGCCNKNKNQQTTVHLFEVANDYNLLEGNICNVSKQGSLASLSANNFGRKLYDETKSPIKKTKDNSKKTVGGRVAAPPAPKKAKRG